MADLNETVPSKIDLTISDFRTSGCAWCHPGGSVLEYDREGYRFDGKPGLFNPGPNPAPKVADYRMAGLVATTTDASMYCRSADCATGFVGAGYFEVTAASATINAPENTINQGTLISAWDPVAGTWKTVGKKYTASAVGGSAEVDCLMCHLSYQYANLERNWGITGATQPKLAASLGLVGAGQGVTGLLNIAAEGTATSNPNVGTAGWTWNEYWGATSSTPGNRVTLRASDFQRKPRKENCALCHFPDKSMAGTAAVTGPASKPLGYTSFQKLMPVGSTRDGDELPGVAGRDGNNDVEWRIAKGRVEGGKRGESINDANNRDAHMKWPGAPAGGLTMGCADCHYNLEGSFAAITDPAQGSAIVQPTVAVGSQDHQFAKGDNTPDGKNMDQLDNTVTCASCHIARTHPNTGSAPNPAEAHRGFPESHFERISCKTCHIPSLNSAMNQDLADFTVGPFRTFERTQTQELPGGVNRVPMRMWRQAEHGQGHWEIQPFDVMAVAVIANATAMNAAGEATSVVPTFQRLGKRSAELLRAAKGDADANGVYDWPLNAPQAGDTSLIVNRPDEIRDFLAQIPIAGGAAAPPNPVLHFYFNQFSLSHNVVPKAGNPINGRYILGSPAGGGCVMCHSVGTAPGSVGFFDRSYVLFTQPTEGGQGLVQTTLPAAPPLSGDLERVSVQFPYSIPLASSGTLPAPFAPTAASVTWNMSVSDGQTVLNAVNAGTLLGYGPAQLDALVNPDTGSFTITASATAGGSITDGPNGPSALGARRVPGLTRKDYVIAPAPGYSLVRLSVNGVWVPVVSTGMTYTFPRLTGDEIIGATFQPAEYTITAKTAGLGQGTVSTADTNPDIACATGNTGICSGGATNGTTVTLTATPATGSIVTGWTGCASVSPDLATCTVPASADRSVTATFQPVSVRLTAATNGSGKGTVSTIATEPDISCTSGSTAGCAGDAVLGASVILTAAPAADSIVTGWSGCQSVSADRRSCTVSMMAPKNVTATFQPATYALSVGPTGSGQGVVTTADTDPDLSCATGSVAGCTGAAPNGSTVTLVATPAAGSIVWSWLGCNTVSADKRTCTVSMTAAKSVRVAFQPETVPLTVQIVGTGTVSTTQTDPDVACASNTGVCAGAAPYGANVTLTSTPAAGSWSGCSSVSADRITCTVPMTAARSVTATF